MIGIRRPDSTTNRAEQNGQPERRIGRILKSWSLAAAGENKGDILLFRFAMR